MFKAYISYPETFLEKAKDIHGDRFDYSKCKFTKLIDYHIFICKKHNIEFFQTAKGHLDGLLGCYKCQISTISKKEIAWLDKVIKLPDDKDHRQVRIYIGDYKYYIVDGFDQVTNTIYEFHGKYWHGDPNLYDADEINLSNKRTFGELYEATIEKESLLRSARL